MFNRSDFPDFMTEASYTRERHGPPPMSPEERAAGESQRQKTEAEIVLAYDRGASVTAIQSSFPSVSSSRIRRIIAALNYSRRFPDQSAEPQFLRELKEKLCPKCYGLYITGDFERFRAGKRSSFPEPPDCPHHTTVH
jgi:hypothetical protein